MESTSRFILGIVAGVASATAINLGLVLQKLAVARGGAGPLFPRLLRDRRWLAGFALQLALGAPLNLAAVGLLGPALVPGVMASGLVVLALASAHWGGERIGAREALGIGAIMAAVAAIGASGLAVDVFARNPAGTELLGRSALMAAAMVALGSLVPLVSAASGRARGAGSHAIALAVASGAWMALSNFALGVAQGSAAWLGSGPAATASLAVSALAVLAANVFAVAQIQGAFVSGKASAVVPVQQVPIQIFPPLVFFFVYAPFAPSDLSLALVGIGVVLVLAGAWLLARGGEASAG
ncbi:MAG: hypothetical protein JXA15_02120 [Spirochaetales bacterium]|nr:hypothetical protein [Spirochaetales bacterium]